MANRVLTQAEKDAQLEKDGINAFLSKPKRENVVGNLVEVYPVSKPGKTFDNLKDALAAAELPE